MEKIINRIDKLIEGCLKTQDENSINEKLENIKKEISNLHIKLFSRSDFFASYLNNNVIKIITNKVDELYEEAKNSAYSKKSRVKYQTINKLYLFQLSITNDYHIYLKGFSEYKSFIKEQIEFKNKKRNSFLSLDLATKDVFIDSKYFEKKVDNLSEVIINYFISNFENDSNIENSKQELLTYYNRLINMKYILEELLNKKQTEFENEEKKENQTDINTYTLEDGNSIIVDNLYEYGYNLVELETIIKNINYHKKAIKQLKEKLENNFLFLQEYKIVKQIPKSIFEGKTLNQIETFLNHLKEFFSDTTDVEDLQQVFSIGFIPEYRKLNFTNGNLNDFGYLIYKLKPYFIEALKAGKTYNSWWSNRFTFNTIEKNNKSISNMISNAKKDGARRPQKQNTILRIIDNLSSIPQ